jgi:uncharacterized membrane protein YczE
MRVASIAGTVPCTRSRPSFATIAPSVRTASTSDGRNEWWANAIATFIGWIGIASARPARRLTWLGAYAGLVVALRVSRAQRWRLKIARLCAGMRLHAPRGQTALPRGPVRNGTLLTGHAVGMIMSVAAKLEARKAPLCG